MPVEVFNGEVKLKGMLPDPPAWHSPVEARFFPPLIFIIWLDAHLKKLCTPHWIGPHKSASTRAPHLLRPALPVGARDKDRYAVQNTKNPPSIMVWGEMS